MPEEHPELPDAPDDHEKDRKLEEEEESLRRDEHTFAAQNAETSAELSTALNAVEMQSFNDSGLDVAQNEPIQPTNVAFADPAELGKRLDELEGKLKEAMVDLSKSKIPAKAYNIQRFQLLVGIVALGTSAAAVYNIIKAETANQPAAAEVPPDVDALVRKLVRRWQEETDAQYWNDLAAYVSNPQIKPPLTIGDQILFMNYTIDLFPGEAFIWDSGQDASNLVDQLISTYHSNGNQTAAMYRAIAGYQYRNAVLPRVAQAQLLRWALVDIAIDE